MKNKHITHWLLSGVLALSLIVSCKKEDPILEPTAEFTSEVDELTVKFKSTSANAVTYSWDFGDNTPVSTEASPTHTYAAKGKYNVVLGLCYPQVQVPGWQLAQRRRHGNC